MINDTPGLHQPSNAREVRYLGLLLLLAAGSGWILGQIFRLDYLIWYIEVGPLLNVAMATVTLAWDLDRLPDLISSRPSRYIDAWLKLVAGWIISFGGRGGMSPEAGRLQRDFDSTMESLPLERLEGASDALVDSILASGRRLNAEGLPAADDLPARLVQPGVLVHVRKDGAVVLPPRSDESTPEERRAWDLHDELQAKLAAEGQGENTLDFLLTTVFRIVLLGVIVLWAVAIAPLQFFVNLVAGAPARSAVASHWVWQYDPEAREFKMIAKSDPVPAGAFSLGYARKPVSLTAGLSALVLVVVGQALLLLN